MPGNSFGQALVYQSWGESHGPAIGCVLDGVPPRLPLSEADIQPFLDRRKPGGSRHVSQRREADRVEILSGVFEGRTTGTPVSLFIRNEDARSKDYDAIRQSWRPGHADFTYDAKYGIRDPRGGGRASARETAMRVAAGAIARRILAGVTIRGAVVQMGPHGIDRQSWDWAETLENPFFCPDKAAARAWAAELDAIRRAGDSLGAVIEIRARGVPAGLGEPVIDRLDADLARALMSINAVKGVEIGAGFAAAAMRGSQAADEIRLDESGAPLFLANHSGGTLGGISSGQELICRFAVKPTSSIRVPRRTATAAGEETDIVTKGRHDPCVGIRAVPVGEAMVALTLADHWLRHRAQCGDPGGGAPGGE